MSQAAFFAEVDKLVLLEAQEVRDALKLCYTSAVADASLGAVAQTNNGITSVHDIVDTLPATDKAGVILLNRTDNGIYQFNTDGLPVLLSYLQAGSICVMVGRDFDSQTFVSLVNRFDNNIFSTPFDSVTMLAKSAVQWGTDTYILRSNATTSDILCINSIESVEYDVDRYEPECLDGVVIKSAIVFQNCLWVTGNGKNTLPVLIKFEKANMEPTVYRLADNTLPSSLTSIDFMAVVGNLLYLFQQGGAYTTESWFTFNTRAFKEVTPESNKGKIKAVLYFNGGYLFIGSNDTTTFGYVFSDNKLGESFDISGIYTQKTNKYISDGKFVYVIPASGGYYQVIKPDYTIDNKKSIDNDLFIYTPFVSKNIVHVLASNAHGDTVMYKSDASGNLLQKYMLETGLSALDATTKVTCVSIGTDENVLLSLDKTLNFLKRESSIAIN